MHVSSKHLVSDQSFQGTIIIKVKQSRICSLWFLLERKGTDHHLLQNVLTHIVYSRMNGKDEKDVCVFNSSEELNTQY